MKTNPEEARQAAIKPALLAGEAAAARRVQTQCKTEPKAGRNNRAEKQLVLLGLT